MGGFYLCRIVAILQLLASEGYSFHTQCFLMSVQDFRPKLKSCHQQWSTPITWICLIRADCKTLFFISCWHGFVFGAPFDICSASLMGHWRTSWVRFPFRTSWLLFSLAEMLAGFCSLGTISGNQVASAWVWKAEQKSTQAVGSFTNWGHCPQELGCLWVTGTLLCTAPWGEQTGTFWWSELPARKHPIKFSVNYFLDVSLKTSVLVPLVYSFVGFFCAGDRTVL